MMRMWSEMVRILNRVMTLMIVILLLGVVSRAINPPINTPASAGDHHRLTEEVKRRRVEFMQKLGPQSMIVLFSTEPKQFEGDVNYEFRQDNNLFYLAGIDQPKTTLVLMPGNQTQKEILFIAPRNPTLELWTGKLLSPEEAKAMSGIETVYESGAFETFIETVLGARNNGPRNDDSAIEYQSFSDGLRNRTAVVYLDLSGHPGRQGSSTPARQFAEQIKERVDSLQVKDASQFLHRLRLVKSAYEIAQLRRAIDITCQAQREAMQTVRPGMFEYEVEAAIEFIFRKNGAPWPGFPSIVASGPNATTLHYDRSSRQMADGDLLLTDIGAEINYYSADVTRTYPVNGRFTPEQAKIYDLVLKAQTEAMNMVRPGASIPQVHARTVAVLKEGLLELGLISSKQGQEYRVWFPHGTSHWLGMNVHDVGENAARFEPGMVLTVEPGLYIRQDTFEKMRRENDRLAATIEPAVSKYSGIGVRIEDDVLVTESGFELLSDKAPKTIVEIEALQGKR